MSDPGVPLHGPLERHVAIEVSTYVDFIKRRHPGVSDVRVEWRLYESRNKDGLAFTWTEA